MFKLLSIICTLFAMSIAYSQVQLVVQPENYALISSGKSAQSAQERLVTQSQSSAVSVEENSNEAVDADQGAPASVTRASASTISTASSATGASRAPLVIASASKSLPTIQHHILPAETIPLPITISTRPGLRTVIAPETITIHQPTVAKIGEVVQKIPTAVSHQSQTIVHKHARVVTPIVAPAVRTITSQVVRAYHTPLVYAPQTPVVQVVRN